MKKFLLTLLPLFLTVSCAPDAKGKLDPPPAGSYTVKLTPDNSGLTADDSTKPLRVKLTAEENEKVTYELEIGAPCYLKTLNNNNLKEIIVKNGAYFKSKSSYKVSRVICDIYEGKGINYEVHDKADGSGQALARHTSEIAPIYQEDSGAVYEYDLASSTEWSIVNKTNNKPAFYSVTILFMVE